MGQNPWEFLKSGAGVELGREGPGKKRQHLVAYS
jgi:hypothetical protein